MKPLPKSPLSYAGHSFRVAVVWRKDGEGIGPFLRARSGRGQSGKVFIAANTSADAGAAICVLASRGQTNMVTWLFGDFYFWGVPIEHWIAIVLTALAAVGFLAGAGVDQ